jgi:carboxylesterase type B
VLPRQPALTFARGQQAKVAVLVGSNESEVSIFASPLVGGHSNRPTTVAAYRAWLEKKFPLLADRVFAVYPAQMDAEVPVAFRTMFTDYDFAFGAWLLARDAAPTGKDAYLYRFTYVGRGPFAALGAFHSEELMFLSPPLLDQLDPPAGRCCAVKGDHRILDPLCENRKSQWKRAQRVAAVPAGRASPGTGSPDRAGSHSAAGRVRAVSAVSGFAIEKNAVNEAVQTRATRHGTMVVR